MTHILGKSPLARYRAWYAMNEMLKQITARSFIVTHKLCIDMCTTVSYYNRKVYINLLFYFILIYFYFYLDNPILRAEAAQGSYTNSRPCSF